MTTDSQFEIRHCHTIDDFRQCVELQKSVWGFDDRDLIPVRMFVVARKVEGQVIAAFAPSGRMAGFCLAIPALHGAQLYLHSHMLAVLPEFRRAGVGQQLKWEQRREALARGIKRIEWTFDPLEWKNAALNLNRLGAIARRYLPNIYGISSSPLHRGLPTDRLVAEWWLDSARVRAAANGSLQLVTPSASRIDFSLTHSIDASDSSHSTASIQQHLRIKFQEAFAAGLAVSSFESTEGTRGAYILSEVDELSGERS
ncbi:MAG: GNAT family N-acetyltransferase [Acidobacteria bacterium]|nr:GNAT family N-acetyltransferase [Acidobacteriota bacterium]